MFARYHVMKDHATLIRALAIVTEKKPNVHLVLAGTGVTVENQSLHRLVQELGVADKVHLLGERQDVAAIMTGLDCLVLSSAWGEGFPNVVAEAMACGVPCIVTDVGDAKAIVGNAGWVVPPRSPQSLASAMRDFLHLSPADRIDFGLRARERVTQEYALDLVVGKYEALFDSL
jgi:glycosyltransferase involved in cell wall biosynthesis